MSVSPRDNLGVPPAHRHTTSLCVSAPKCASGAVTHPTAPPRYARLTPDVAIATSGSACPLAKITLEYRTTGQAKLGVGACLQETDLKSETNQ